MSLYSFFLNVFGNLTTLDPNIKIFVGKYWRPQDLEVSDVGRSEVMKSWNHTKEKSKIFSGCFATLRGFVKVLAPSLMYAVINNHKILDTVTQQNPFKQQDIAGLSFSALAGDAGKQVHPKSLVVVRHPR